MAPVVRFAGWLMLLAGCGASSATGPANEPNVVVVEPPPAAQAGDASMPDATNEGPEQQERVATAAEKIDNAQPAIPGQSLGNGTYVFEDGLRVEYRYKQECDYDVSVPCIWSHEVTASFGQSERHLSLTRSKPKAIAVGHTFEVVKDRLVVRR
jgi:hypothetical protein